MTTRIEHVIRCLEEALEVMGPRPPFVMQGSLMRLIDEAHGHAICVRDKYEGTETGVPWHGPKGKGD